MSVLARAPGPEIAVLAAELGPLPAYQILKAPETGTVMLEGRAGGTGRRFNAGEATVTRAAVRLADDTMGVAYALGTDKRKAELAAVLDGLLQSAVWRDRILTTVIRPLAAAEEERRTLASRKAAATKVDFFTLVRGDG